MAETELAVRVSAYLERQARWFQDQLRRLDEFDAALAAGGLADFAEAQARSASELETFTKEHRVLLREWRARTDVPSEERRAVRALARRAEQLQRDVLARYARTSRRVDDALASDRADLTGLRRGKDWLAKYRPGGGEQPAGLFDTKA